MGRTSGYRWLAGDHHVHTQYSGDGKYRVVDQVRQGRAHGLRWLVITDHGGTTHAKLGVDKVHPDIVRAREEYPDMLVFQGLEWNVPAAEHATVFVHPGREEATVLKEFETAYDGWVTGTTAVADAHKELALSGLGFLADALEDGRVDDVLFLVNHPSRRGLDAPRDIRNWRDAQPHIAVGMEGAPGHQAAGLPASRGPGRHRGHYGANPGPDSYSLYPPESYRTFGGFDWMTATVGGLWDSMLAEGRPWWITVNSDSHDVMGDTSVRGPGSDFAGDGRHADPVYGAEPNRVTGDHWPGQYSRTHVGAAALSYQAVMDGLRAGRVWVDHGGLLSGLHARLRAGDRTAGLGETLTVRRGEHVDLVVDVTPATAPNWTGKVPGLARVDVVQGDVTGNPGDPDAFRAPDTRVVRSFEVDGAAGTVRLTHPLGRLDRPVYVRLRGTDGNRGATGLHGAAVDPHGPALDVQGDVDPWQDLWFYSNPMWVVPSDGPL
ncbi:PHP domain-containing protein [Streptomyces narbonensis]|uniref:PHP domain-containing protein n=1 Tax=Streptomyces narbonensis TaxID=67333 RepID=UPI001675B61A|nr:PHP domain-containing protein [Streptomyces narbonensis]GGV95266.1 histidinol-phosphatase [Streptomyces narbonensis]